MEVSPADLRARTVDDRIVGMELAVRGFVGLLNALDALDGAQLLDEADVDLGDVADAADQRLMGALRHVRRNVPRGKPILQVLDLALVRILLQYDNHFCMSPFLNQQRPRFFWSEAVMLSVGFNPISMRQPRSDE